ncbi:MAG: NAD(P)-dependent alcohol dehydrogenase [Acidimicrobiales bacterium]
MRAIVHDHYGDPDVLELRDLELPSVEGDQLLVKVHTASVHPGDWLMMMGRPLLFRPVFGLRGPRKRIPGFDFSGTVEAVGPEVSMFAPGDEVFGDASGGSCAEYLSVPESKVVRRPPSLGLDQVAVIPVSGTTALKGLRDAGQLTEGQHVLINGASGGVGTFAVQIAKTLGAEVTGVCGTGNVELVREIGADHVIDYTSDDFTQGTARYDLILDNVANRSLADCRRVLTPGGKLLTNNGTSGNRWIGPLGRMAAAATLSLFVPTQGRPFYAPVTTQDLVDLTELIEAGSLVPVISQTFGLEDTAQAMRLIGEGHAGGKVAITI